MIIQVNKYTSDYTFIGWVPCVIGSLNFSKLSTEQLPYSSTDALYFPICFSYTNEHSTPSFKNQKIINVASSVFDWKDRDDKEKQCDGEFRFITIASTNEVGSMVGKAYILLDSDIQKVPAFIEDVLNPFNTLQQEINEYQIAIADDQYSPSKQLESIYVESKLDNIEKVLQRYSQGKLKGRIITIEYVVLANGLTFLKPLNRIGIDDNPELKESVERSNFIAIKQSFIYIKSSLHTHKHHDVKEDRLTIVHPIDPEEPKLSAVRLIDDLQRSIIEVKDRECKNLESPKHYLLGFISYAKSLVESLLEVELISEPVAKRKKVYFDNMLQSWRSFILRSDMDRNRKAEKKNKSSEATNETFQALSMLVAVFSLMYTGVTQIYAAKGIENAISGSFFESLLPLFTTPIYQLYTFLIFGVLLLVTLTYRILFKNRTFFTPLLNRISSKSMLYSLRGLMFFSISASVVILLGWLLGVTAS